MGYLTVIFHIAVIAASLSVRTQDYAIWRV